MLAGDSHHPVQQQHPGTGQCWIRKGREGKERKKFTSRPRSGAGRTMFRGVVELQRFLFSCGQEL